MRYDPNDDTAAYSTVVNFGNSDETINVLEGIDDLPNDWASGIAVIDTDGNAG